MKRFHRSNTISAPNHSHVYDTIPAMLPRSGSVKRVTSRRESITPPPPPPPRNLRPPFQRNASLPEFETSELMVKTASSGHLNSPTHVIHRLVLVEKETQNIEDLKDLEFLPNAEAVAGTLHEEIAMELSKHLLESAPSPAPSSKSRESPYEVIDQDTDDSVYVHMGSDPCIRWSTNSSECDGSLSSEISEKLDCLTARIHELTNIVETSSKGEPTSAGKEALAENSPSREELQPCDRSLSPCEQNRQLLATLDCNQVQLLLDAMNLSQYKEAFQQEQVSGEILLECDEDILEKELHVSSRIHQIRLMKVINGKTSAHNILNESQYIAFVSE